MPVLEPWQPPKVTTTTEQYLRVASLSIALYDYILTLPAEWRVYRSQRSLAHPSLSCCLFMSIRYVSAVVMVASNVGFFSHAFSEEVCARYYIVAPVFKVLQNMISQLILGFRTYNISRRSRTTGCILLVLFFIVTTLEWFTNMYERMPISRLRNCTPGNAEEHLVAWLYYLFAMLYDFGTLCISIFYLAQFNPDHSPSTRVTRLIRMMLYDGLLYFVALTGVNVFNTILYRTSDEALQPAVASLGYAVTWIMSQKILIHLHDAALERAYETGAPAIVAHSLRSPRDISQAVRSQFEEQHQSNASVDHASKIPQSGLSLDHGDSSDLAVEVRVERFMTVEWDEHAYERESYRIPRTMWSSSSRR
ncbi:hypothetical protein GLOTRDRAFT_100675, partial [Gloeophyllum trabeum ATCC 11539]